MADERIYELQPELQPLITDEVAIDRPGFFRTKKISIKRIIDFIKANAATGPSGFIPVTGFALPDVPDKQAGYTVLGKGSFTQSNGQTIETTELFNELGWNGTSWFFIRAIDTSGLAGKADLQNKGNFDTVPLAVAGVPIYSRKLGDKVNVKTANGIVEYWWKDGLSDVDLVPVMNDITNITTLGGIPNFISGADLTERGYSGSGTTVTDVVYTQLSEADGRTFTPVIAANEANRYFLDTAKPLVIEDGKILRYNFKTTAFTSANPMVGIGFGNLATPYGWGIRQDGQLLKIYKTSITSIAAANALYALQLNVWAFIEIRRTASVYEFRANNGTNTTPWYVMDVAPTGSLFISTRGVLAFKSYFFTPVELANTKELKAYADLKTADKATVASIPAVIEDELKDEDVLSTLPNVNYPGYTLSGSSNTGSATTPIQSSDVNGLDILLSGGNAASLNSVELIGELWDDVVELTFVVGTDLAGATPAISIGYGNPRANGNGYKSLFYWANGGAFGLKINADNSKNLTANIISRAATTAYALANSDTVSLKIDKKKQQFITSKNGVYHPAIPFTEPFEPTGNIFITTRGATLQLNNAKLRKIKQGLLNPVNAQVTILTAKTDDLAVKVSQMGGGVGLMQTLSKYLNTDIVHVDATGQSRSVGTQSQPPISVVQRYNSKKFHGGTKPFYDPKTQDYFSSFDPLIETEIADPNIFGETPLSGIFESMHELLISKGINYVVNDDMQFLGTAPGQGSTAIAGLLKGTIPYGLLINGTIQGKSLANSIGKTYSKAFVFWDHGETDITNGTSKAAYKAALIQLYYDYNTDIKAITGQKNDVILIMDQVASHNVRTSPAGYDKTSIAQAQYELAIDDNYPNIIMSSPCYTLDYVTDNVHLTNIGSKINGVFHGNAAIKFIENGGFKPIHVVSTFFQANILELNMIAPVGPLVFDTVRVVNPGNYGFRLFNSANVEQTINAVSIVRGNTVKIISSVNIEAGFYVTYAFNGTTTGATNGSRGNLRDSQDFVFDPTGLNYNIYNWCPMFKYIL